MPTKAYGGRDSLIHCPNCGEDYASAYRRCPFCNAKPVRGRQYEEDERDTYAPANPRREERVGYEEPYDDDPPAPARGGKRLDSQSQRGSRGRSRDNTAGGGYGGGPSPLKVAAYVASLVVILVALWLVIFKLGPKIAGVFSSGPATQTETPLPSLAPSAPPTPTPTPTPVSTPSPAEPTLPAIIEPPVSQPAESQPPATTTDAPGQPPVTGGALRLSREDFTLSDKYPTYTVRAEGATGQVTWTVADSTVATVNQNGLVTAVKNGTTRLTATDEGGATAQCTVRVSGFTGGAAAEPAPSANPAPSEPSEPATGAKLSASDITFSERNGYTATLRVLGGAAASWASSDTTVAAVTQSGVVSGLKEGTATITCTLEGGETLTCLVRVR